MTNEEKAVELTEKYSIDFPEAHSSAYPLCYKTAIKIATWKDAQLDKAFEKALEHHSNKLKEGKITQYGMDNVFAFVQNVRTLLNSEL